MNSSIKVAENVAEIKPITWEQWYIKGRHSTQKQN
jgi:hypothetical protein